MHKHTQLHCVITNTNVQYLKTKMTMMITIMTIMQPITAPAIAAPGADDPDETSSVRNPKRQQQHLCQTKAIALT